MFKPLSVWHRGDRRRGGIRAGPCLASNQAAGHGVGVMSGRVFSRIAGAGGVCVRRPGSSARRTAGLIAFAVIAALCIPVTAAVASPRTVLVVPTQYPTIQAAVDASQPDDVVWIRPGIYNEQVSIDHDLTVLGAGAFRTTIHAPGVLVPGSLGLSYLVDIHDGATVTISGLTVRGPGPNPCGDGSLNAGIKVHSGASLQLSAARVLDIVDTPAHDCFPQGSGIVVGDRATGEVGSATIRAVEVSHYQFHAIGVYNAGSTATIMGNVLDAQVGPSDVVAPVGVQIGNGALAVVTYNVIRGNRCERPELGCGADPATQVQSAALANGSGDPPAPGTEFAHNVLADNDVGVYMFDAGECCDVHHNLMVGNRFFGVVIQDGESSVSHDTIIGGQTGVGVIADSADTVGTLEHEHISGTSGPRISISECCGFTATVKTT
jgi:hypothetical protein